MALKWTRSKSGLTESAIYQHDEEATYLTVAIRPVGVEGKKGYTRIFQAEDRWDAQATIEQETETLVSMMLNAVRMK